MKIHLHTTFPCKIRIEHELINLKVGEILCLSNFFNGTIYVEPNSENLCAYEVEILKISKNKFVKTIKLENDFYFCELQPKYSLNIENEFCLINKVGGKDCLTKYYVGDYSYFCFFNENFSIKQKFQGIDNCFQYKKTVASTEFLFSIINIKEKKYLFLMTSKKLIWSGYFKEINVLDGDIIILEDNNSCLGEKLVNKYKVQEGEFQKYPVVYKKRNLEFLSPVPAFLDAIMVHNFTLMKKLLVEDLSSICDETIFEFCGEFDDYFFVEDYVILTKNFEAQKVLRFKISDNLITDIIS